ncbi:ABA4-like family protein [Flagellimonas meridianipacifica]|uniref:Uncharacterized protein DUF4281 n=1 Tax=Flagellimonas meridianipacifica TaxID=1080225 RepID=A0A2T0MBI1_9FLAO|nr:ABA4-like family protein [Allomuricauda pacifica]PRX54835.1 uncharacterized protein DUF4281 [Allomuricauda pacifica]
MTNAEIFSIANTMAMPMWLLLIILPKWKVTRFLIDYKVIPLLLSLFYAHYIILHLQAGGGLDFGSLSSVMSLFTLEDLVMAGWVHYLAFDLLVGMWMINQNRNLGIHQILMAPCLIATFMLGPVGFLLFTVLKTIKSSRS